MKKSFLTFACSNYRNLLNLAFNLTNQIKSTDIFDDINLYNKEYLINDNEFWNKHKDFILNNKRGYGYWIWKPYLIKKTIDNLNNGDIILYMDADSAIKINEIDYLYKYLEEVQKTKIIVENNFKENIGKPHDLAELQWNKMDLINKLNMDINYLNNKIQTFANTIILYVCEETRNLINEWYNIACDYHYIDDTPSIIPNHFLFREHRHDQSILSLLIKKNNLYNEKIIIDKCLYKLRNF